jgi:hypothetical protein
MSNPDVISGYKFGSEGDASLLDSVTPSEGYETHEHADHRRNISEIVVL